MMHYMALYWSLYRISVALRHAAPAAQAMPEALLYSAAPVPVPQLHPALLLYVPELTGPDSPNHSG